MFHIIIKDIEKVNHLWFKRNMPRQYKKIINFLLQEMKC